MTGLKVICINDEVDTNYVHPIKLGMIYTIRSVFSGTNASREKRTGYRLEEIINTCNPLTQNEYGYDEHYFAFMEDDPIKVENKEKVEA